MYVRINQDVYEVIVNDFTGTVALDNAFGQEFADKLPVGTTMVVVSEEDYYDYCDQGGPR